MKVGSIVLDNPVIQAPLAGISNLPFRLICKAAGAGLVCSEMVSANGLVQKSAKTIDLLKTDPTERPLSVQIFGCDAEIMAEAAARVQELGADILDVNCGCSVRKVLRSGSGSALMREPEKARPILKAVRKAVTIPFTLKMRTGWDATGNQALLLSRIAEEEGLDAVCIHPRTAVQGFSGHSDWSVIRRIKAALSIPVIGNGDITTPEDAVRMRAETGCDAVMIGRAGIGDPTLFARTLAALMGRKAAPATVDDRFAAMERYLDATVEHIGEPHGCRILRSRLCWFAKGLRHATAFRTAIRFIETREEALSYIRSFRAALDILETAGQGEEAEAEPTIPETDEPYYEEAI